MPREGSAPNEKGRNKGWIASFVILAAVFVAAAALWFMFHP